MALSSRKKAREGKKKPLKRRQGNTSVKKTAAKSAAATLKRVPVTKRSASVLSSKVGAPAYQGTPRELPDNYGDNQIYLLIRDPYWVYTYWEIQEDHQRHHLEKLGGSWESVVSVLRVYDTTEEGKVAAFFDVVLQNMVKSWYLNTQPNHSYFVEIGLLHRDGRFLCLARSNHVTTPRSGMSEVIDDQWMSVDFEKMYALSGGFEVGKSSAELHRLMEERLNSAITSGSGASVVSGMSSPMVATPPANRNTKRPAPVRKTGKHS